VINRQDAKNIIDKAISHSKLPQCRVDLTWTEDVFVRFARNGITTSGYRTTQQVSITAATEDRREGTAIASELSDDALLRAVQQAEQLALISPPNPENMPELGPQEYPVLDDFDSDTGSARGDLLIPHVKAQIEMANEKQLTAAGYIQRSANAIAAGNKAGAFGYHTYTDASLTSTVRNAGGTSSGWAEQSSVRLRDISGEAVARASREKCLRGAGSRRQLSPGQYTVILEPAAVADLAMWLSFAGFSARDAEQGQSFLSKQGGGTRLGDKMFPEFITLRSDPANGKLWASPWASSLLPNRPTAWIENGVVKNLVYDRYWAARANKEPTPDASNLLLEGQDNGIEELIRSAGRALLVTRFWYVRMLQPQTLQLTGLTRDGVFLVENGQVTDPVNNFRWNESPARVLENVKRLGRPVRSQGSEGFASIVPPLVAENFTFASVSEAV
jgi:predicted Zn-dependent protease